MRIRILLTLLVFALLLGVSTSTVLAAPQAVCISTQSGNWDAVGMWSCGYVPTNTDIVIINNGHDVTLNTNGAAYQLIVGGGASGSLSLGSYTLDVGAGGLSISNGATLNGNSGTLNVAGNLTNNGTFNAHTSTVVMNSTAAQSISGIFIFNNLTINANTDVTLNSDATVNGTLTLNDDLTVASGKVLTMGSSSSTAGNYDVVGKVKRTSSSTSGTYGSQYTTITFTAGTPPTDIVVELFKTAPGGLANAVQRYYSITPTDGSGYTFNLRLHYLDGELGSIPEGDLYIWQQVGGRWTLRGRDSNNTSDNWVQKDGLSSFSLWALSNSGAPTAVNLSTLDARADAPNALPLLGLSVLALLALGVWRSRR